MDITDVKELRLKVCSDANAFINEISATRFPEFELTEKLFKLLMNWACAFTFMSPYQTEHWMFKKMVTLRIVSTKEDGLNTYVFALFCPVFSDIHYHSFVFEGSGDDVFNPLGLRLTNITSNLKKVDVCHSCLQRDSPNVPIMFSRKGIETTFDYAAFEMALKSAFKELTNPQKVQMLQRIPEQHELDRVENSIKRFSHSFVKETKGFEHPFPSRENWEF